MRKGLVSVLILVVSAGFAFAGNPLKNTTKSFKSESAPSQELHSGNTLIAFDKMYGVDGPSLDVPFPVGGILGDELPWEIRSAQGRLDTDGHLTLKVRGLVFTHDDEVPADLQGTNDEPQFRAAVACVTEEGESLTTKTVISSGFTATPSGNATIKTTLELPNPCIAPVVFVLAGSEEKWFAVTGFESDEGEDGN